MAPASSSPRSRQWLSRMLTTHHITCRLTPAILGTPARQVNMNEMHAWQGWNPPTHDRRRVARRPLRRAVATHALSACWSGGACGISDGIFVISDCISDDISAGGGGGVERWRGGGAEGRATGFPVKVRETMSMHEARFDRQVSQTGAQRHDQSICDVFAYIASAHLLTSSLS